MSGSESDEEEPYVKFCDRPHFADVVPVPQDDPAPSPCSIRYHPKYVDMMDYFRGLVKVGELSLRTLEVTHACLLEAPSNFTVWFVRRRTLEVLNDNALWEAELKFTEEVAHDNPKCYQLWCHRRAVVIRLQRPMEEVVFTAALLGADDEKNYHIWSHRQWVIECFGYWEGELAFTEALIGKDAKNNSAWHQRLWVITSTSENGVIPSTVLSRESSFALKFIEADPRNESPWNFLRGLFEGIPVTDHVSNTVRGLVFNGENISSEAPPHALSFLFDFSNEKEKKNAFLHALIETDKVRENYWKTLLVA